MTAEVSHGSKSTAILMMIMMVTMMMMMMSMNMMMMMMGMRMESSAILIKLKLWRRQSQIGMLHMWGILIHFRYNSSVHINGVWRETGFTCLKEFHHRPHKDMQHHRSCRKSHLRRKIMKNASLTLRFPSVNKYNNNTNINIISLRFPSIN